MTEAVNLTPEQVREVVADVLGTVQLALQREIVGPSVGEAIDLGHQRAHKLLADITSAHSNTVRFWVDGGMMDGKNPSKVGVYWSAWRALPEGTEGLIIKRHYSIEHFTNNEAEWLALRAALRFALTHHAKEQVQIYSDSQLVVNQFNGKWRCRIARLLTLARQCWDLAEKLPTCTLTWAPRREMIKRLGH